MNLPTFRDLLAQHFNLEELKQLCFDLGVDYDNLGGETKDNKTQSLLQHALRHGRLQTLQARCEELRPTAEWPDTSALSAEWNKVQQALEAQSGLQGVLPDEQLADMLAPLHQKEADLLARLIGSGAVAQGAGATAVGERGVVSETAGLIVTGDNVSVQTIINRYGDGREQSPDTAALSRQIDAYLTWLIDWAGTVELRGIQRQGEQVVQLPLEKVYVPLAATIYGEHKPAIDLNELLSLGRRLILTGGPGSGKTTALLHVAWALSHAIAADDPDLAEDLVGFVPAKFKRDDDPEKTEIEALPLPIFVPLSAYAAHRRSLGPREDGTLAAFISHYLFARQTSFDLPDDFFRCLLRQGRAVLLLLDGLDEVPDETERAHVRQAIEDLVTGRERMRIVVSCRSAAYQGRTALGKGFREVTVQPLEDEHVAALVEHAYTHIYRSDPVERRFKTDELLQGIQRLEQERSARLGEKATRLIDSPLLVRMLLIVHYRERRLPEQRAELYMKATNAMLLPDYLPDTTTADFIGQLIGGNWEVHRDLVQHLAFHMHQRGAEQGREIAEDDLRRVLNAEPAYAPLVDDFVRLTRLRGTLLEERLSTYRFLHLAFQEYLAARYLAEIVRSEGGIETVVAFLEGGPLLETWWREVVLLVSGYFSVTSPQIAQTFLERLAGIDRAATTRQPLLPQAQLAAAELAGVAWLEWPAQRQELRRRLANRLADLFTDPDLMSQAPAVTRATAGRVLARLGDPRPNLRVVVYNGVKLPHIVWGKELPAGEYTYQLSKVAIEHSFRLARYPITYAQFQCFVEAPDFAKGRWWAGMPPDASELGEQQFLYANHPRENVSWYQAIAFCRWLTARLHTGELQAGPLNGEVRQWEIALPREYEWETAARYPDGRDYPWGLDFDVEKANTDESKIGGTTAVGIYPAGRQPELELYDLSGDVWEWCRNKYNNPDDDRVDAGGDWRALRGGSWYNERRFARAAYRLARHPDLCFSNYGFRVALVRRSPSHHDH